MGSKPRRKLEEDLEHLRNDAAKVVDDIGRLSSRIGFFGKAKGEEFANRAHDRVAAVKGKVTDLNLKARDKAHQLDTHVHEHPYTYLFATILGVIGVGLIATKYFTSSRA